MYDFGVLPDEIPGKGVATCAMAVRSFELLAAAGVATHFVERVADDAIRVRLLHVDPTGEHGPTGPATMIPLQVVYRHALPRESSVHRRLAAGTLDPALVPPYRSAGAPWLAEPMVEFTTKFEETDRFVDRAGAAAVGRVAAADLDAIADLAATVADVVAKHCAEVGLTMADGKAEFGFDADRRPILIDHAGTPDENRFYFNGVPVCKELLRYLHPDLRERVQRYVADGVPRAHWEAPPPLRRELVDAAGVVYRALAATWTGHREPDLAAAVRGFVAAVGSDLTDRTGL